MLIPILTLIEIKISRKLLNGIKSDRKTILIAYRKGIFLGNHHYHTLASTSALIFKYTFYINCSFAAPIDYGLKNNRC